MLALPNYVHAREAHQPRSALPSGTVRLRGFELLGLRGRWERVRKDPAGHQCSAAGRGGVGPVRLTKGSRTAGDAAKAVAGGIGLRIGRRGAVRHGTSRASRGLVNIGGGEPRLDLRVGSIRAEIFP